MMAWHGMIASGIYNNGNKRFINVSLLFLIPFKQNHCEVTIVEFLLKHSSDTKLTWEENNGNFLLSYL